MEVGILVVSDRVHAGRERDRKGGGGRKGRGG